MRCRRKRENFATDSIAFWWIYNTNRRRRRRSACLIQRCYRGWKSWIVQEKWRITASLERDAQKKRDQKEKKGEMIRERNIKLEKKKIKRSGIDAAVRVGFVEKTKKESKEAAKQRFNAKEDAVRRRASQASETIYCC